MQCLVDLIGSTDSTLLTWVCYQVTQKAAGFEWGLEQKALEQGQAAVQTALPLGSQDPADLVLRCQWQEGCCLEPLAATLGQSQRTLGFGSKTVLSSEYIIFPLRESS